MSWLSDLSIRRKLVAIITVTTATALLLANGALLIWDFVHYRSDLEDDLRSSAEVVGINSTAAIRFGDPDTATQLLSSLGAQPHVRWAVVYGADGQVFARYARAAASSPPSQPPADGSRLVGSGLEVTHPIVLDGGRIGTISVRGSLDALYGRMRRRTATVALVVLGAGLLALLLTQRLHRLVSDPLLRLTALARAVTADRNYSLRATAGTGDEIGLLVGAFNDMLVQIERRDADLIASKDLLEQRVEERTAQLQQELIVRHRAERELAARNEELVHTNQELDDFAYVASHDLKEPLRGIHNYAQFLLEDHGEAVDEDGRAKLRTLIRLSRRMEGLIDSLLHYSRLGRGDLTFAIVDVNDLVTETLDTLALILREHRVDVRIPHRLPVVRADRDRLGEVFANLMTNAVKYNDKAQRWIEIGAAESDGPDARVTFYVRDNGIGIAERHIDSVFRIFKRLHGRDEFGGGAGAGLTIVRKIVDRHGGRVWIESAPGAGTTVFFTLPRGA